MSDAETGTGTADGIGVVIQTSEPRETRRVEMEHGRSQYQLIIVESCKIALLLVAMGFL